jgi:hypothetical protein
MKTLPLNQQQCSNCKFKIGVEGQDLVECHRHAPTVVRGQASQVTNTYFSFEIRQAAALWPLVDPETDWCGEYETDPRDQVEGDK